MKQLNQVEKKGILGKGSNNEKVLGYHKNIQ